MAEIEYIIPGHGTFNDTEEGFEPVVPGHGIVQEQEVAAPPAGVVPQAYQIMRV